MQSNYLEAERRNVMKLTGHPFIDVGMAIAARLAQRDSVEQLTSADLAAAVSHLDAHMADVQRLKF